MPAIDTLHGECRPRKMWWLKKYQGSTPISIKEIHFSDGVYSVSGRARKFVALVASVRI